MISTFKNKVFIYLYISIDDISTKLPTYAYQQYIIWNSFNKCMEIDVQVKYEKLNDDDLYCRSPSLSVMSYHSLNLVWK